MNNYTKTTNDSPFTPEEIEEHGITEEQIAAYTDNRSQYDTPALNPNATQEEKELILGKFESQDELEKAYLELQKRFSRGEHKDEQQETPANESPDEVDNDTDTKDKESTEETTESSEEATEETRTPSEEEVTEAIEKVEDETARTALSEIFERAKRGEDTSKELEKIALEAGIPQDFIDTWKQKTSEVADKSADEQLTSFYEAAGGKDEFSKITEWAGKNWSEQQIETFNNIMDKGSEEEVKFTISNLKSMYDMSNKEPQVEQKSQPKMVKADSIAPLAGSQYKSQAEFQRDLSDPRYQTDEAYRAAVMQKLSRSNI